MNELMDDLGHHLRRTNGAMKQIKQMTRMTKTQPDAEPLPLRLSPPEDCLKEENEFLSLPSPIWVLVTPELAKTWLDLNVRNRKIRPHHVSSLVREYWSGGWRVTSEPGGLRLRAMNGNFSKGDTGASTSPNAA